MEKIRVDSRVFISTPREVASSWRMQEILVTKTVGFVFCGIFVIFGALDEVESLKRQVSEHQKEIAGIA